MKLSQVLTKIQKEIGKDVLINLEEKPQVDRVNFSSPKMNYVFGGGCPRGRIIEYYGPESSGKSLIATITGADYQKEGLFVAYVDLEGTFDKKFAETLGLSTSPDQFVLFQPEVGEDALKIIEELSSTGEVGLIIVDSVAAMTPRAELEGDYGDSHMGLQARMLSQGMRKLNGIVRKTNTTLIFVNQIRMKIGVMYGNPEVTTGGKALQFYASVRNRVTRVEDLMKGKDVVGQKIRIANTKSKIGVPKRKIEIDMYFNRGVDTVSEFADFAISYGFIEKAGSWYVLPNGERVQGKERVYSALREDEELFNPLKVAVIERMNNVFKTSDNEIDMDSSASEDEEDDELYEDME